MKVLLFKFGRKKAAFKLEALAFEMGKHLGLSKSEVKRLIKQGGVSVEFREL